MCVSNKKNFYSEHSALTAMGAMIATAKRKGQRLKLTRAYKCRDCPCWHLTSQK